MQEDQFHVEWSQHSSSVNIQAEFTHKLFKDLFLTIKFQLLDGELKEEYSIGLEETAGGRLGENLDFLKFKCIKIILVFKLNAFGEVLRVSLCNTISIRLFNFLNEWRVCF
jgi:hypothetical protein